MYTTLALLKAVSACKPGYGRQIAFFGLKCDRDQKIPMHVIGLVGGLDDFIWTLDHGAIIDKDDFAAFRARTLVGVWRNLCDQNFSGDDYIRGKHSHTTRAAVEACELRTSEEIEHFLSIHQQYHFDVPFYEKVVHARELVEPLRYLKFVKENIARTIPRSSKVYPAMAAEIAGKARPTRLSAPMELDLSAQSKAARRAKMAGAALAEAQNTEELEEISAKKRSASHQNWAALSAKFGAGYKASIPSASSLPSFPPSTQDLDKAQRLAELMSLTPYAFLTELQYRSSPDCEIQEGRLVVKVDAGHAAFTMLNTYMRATAHGGHFSSSAAAREPSDEDSDEPYEDVADEDEDES